MYHTIKRQKNIQTLFLQKDDSNGLEKKKTGTSINIINIKCTSTLSLEGYARQSCRLVALDAAR